MKKLINNYTMVAANGATLAKTEGSPFSVIQSNEKWRILIGLSKNENNIPIIEFSRGYGKSPKVYHFVAKNREEAMESRFTRPNVFDPIYVYIRPYVIGNVLKFANNGSLAIAEAVDENGKRFQIATDTEFLKRTSDEYNICWYHYDPA